MTNLGESLAFRDVLIGALITLFVGIALRFLPLQILIPPAWWSQLTILIIAAAAGTIIALIVTKIYRSREPKSTIGPPWHAMLTFGVGLLIGLIVVLGQMGPATVTITAPQNNGAVQWQSFVEGTSQNIPQGNSIWIIVIPLNVTRYYPQSAPVDVSANGEWSTKAYFGETSQTDVGAQFKVSAIIVNSEAKKEIQNYLDVCSKGSCPGMTSLPDGAQIQDSVIVTKVAS
jgi:hypothetical protein